MNDDGDDKSQGDKSKSEEAPAGSVEQEIERCVRLAASHELDLGTTWGDQRVQAFAERIAQRAALLARGRADSTLGPEASRATRGDGALWPHDVDEMRSIVERELVEAAERAEQVDDHPPYDHAFATRVAARVAEAAVRQWRIAVASAREVRQMVRAAVMAGLPEGASSLAIQERALDADVIATRVYDGLYGRSTVGLCAADREILRRLRDNKALLERLLGAGSL